ncbi:helix-turn-helix domain-containing protein [Flavobacterium humi]|uniref:XRE family transcriptional regulator n=1 Tax=Flavobacterium humi TaxID=2562683 RepID=A0A4Z0L6P2_9FLAO|nr:helix-turn-helix transcriptional regulator [Flavobacterium humi]TGD58067.1 XRE family transcriptional regulator [Flavobacterium humi]
MLYFNFARIFEIKGINRPFTYLVSLGYSKGYATRIANNQVTQVNAERLERFCRDFNCTPNDIFDYRPYSKKPLPEGHALLSLTKPEITNEVLVKINTLPLEKIQQIHDIIKNIE